MLAEYECLASLLAGSHEVLKGKSEAGIMTKKLILL
jgi:hypothetical protein